jgi:SAM-dependent methyltransferase
MRVTDFPQRKIAKLSYVNKQNGIPPGNWNYINEPAVARQYDASLENNEVASHDALIVADYLLDLGTGSSKVVVDFGCGTGRSLLPAVERGHVCVGIDLSQAMLDEARRKLREVDHRLADDQGHREQPCPWSLIQGDLLRLDWLAPQSYDLGLCLFSTLGMLRGRENRQRFLRSACRGLKPGGRLLVHGHNVWHQATFPGGRRWLAQSLLWSLTRPQYEFGDRYADHSLVNQLFLHSFTLAGFKQELENAGLTVETIHPVGHAGEQGKPKSSSPIGWLMACRV